MKRPGFFLLAGLAVLTGLLLAILQRSPPGDTVALSALSLAPAVIAIGLAFLTRQVLLALFLGIVSGGLVMAWQSGDISQANVVANLFIPALGSPQYATILLVYLWCLGGLIGMWEKTGGALHFAETVGSRLVVGPRSALFFAWLVGCVFHQGGTISTVLAGTTVKPVADKHKISHEELSYVVDSTASPVATILPFNAWPVFVAGLVVSTIPLFDDPNGEVAMSKTLAFFFSSIPFNFYAMFAVLGTLLTSLGVMPWVGRRMAAARSRARESGALDREGARPMLPPISSESIPETSGESADVNPLDNRMSSYTPNLWDFCLPLGVLLGLAIIPYVLFDTSFINEAFLASVLSAMVLAGLRGMSLSDILDGFTDGARAMTFGAIVLGLAVTIGYASRELKTAEYLVGIIGADFPQIALPAILSVLCMVIAFSCGTSWGTYAVIFPVAMPLAYSLNPDPIFVHVCFGAVLGGAVFGDQCSPISDTTVLSSMFTGCDLMDHVNSQLPLALLAASLAVVASTITVLFL